MLQDYLKLSPVCPYCVAPPGRYPNADGRAFVIMAVMIWVLVPLFGIVWNV